MKDKLLKVIAWRLISITITLIILAVVMGDVGSATGITFFLHGFLTVCHFAFENLWEKFHERG